MRIERVEVAEIERLGGPAAVAKQLRELVLDGASVEQAVREIVADVRARGDAAVLEYTQRFDTAGIEPRELLVAPEELDEAIKSLPLELVAGLQVTIANVAQVADAGVDRDASVALPQGQHVKLREIPVSAAAIYVPGGRAPYPSTVAMGVVTARAAGVLDVVVCAPPGPDGQIHAAILGACRLCGVERVYRMGGAQAIAALAYGTETVARVDVVVGPGNLYVQEAKRQLSATVGIDGFAGPSDLLVVLGQEPEPHEIELAALDMLAQGEHGEGSLVVGRLGRARSDRRAGGATRCTRRGASYKRWNVRARRGDRFTAGDPDRERVRARAPAADRHRCRGACATSPVGRLRIRRLGERDGVRRLRRRLEPHPADERRGALRFDALAAALPQAHGRGADRLRRGRKARESRRADRASGGL